MTVVMDVTLEFLGFFEKALPRAIESTRRLAEMRRYEWIDAGNPEPPEGFDRSIGHSDRQREGLMCDALAERQRSTGRPPRVCSHLIEGVW